MWTVLPQAFRDFHENVPFRLNIDHWRKEQWDVCESPIVCFKAATIGDHRLVSISGKWKQRCRISGQGHTALSPTSMQRSSTGLDKTVINLQTVEHQRVVPAICTMPVTQDCYEIYLYTAGPKMARKVCPETDCQEINLVGEPEVSIVEKFSKQDQPLWSERVKKVRERRDQRASKPTWIWQQWRFNWTKQQLEQLLDQADATPPMTRMTALARPRRHLFNGARFQHLSRMKILFTANDLALPNQ